MLNHKTVGSKGRDPCPEGTKARDLSFDFAHAFLVCVDLDIEGRRNVFGEQFNQWNVGFF